MNQLQSYYDDVFCKGEGVNWTALRDAIAQGHIHEVRALLSRNPPSWVNLRDEHQRTPLHWACRQKMDPNHKSLPVLEVLLSHGANTSAMDHERHTPLDVAVAGGRLDVVKCLLAVEHVNGQLPMTPEVVRTVTAQWDVNAANTGVNGQTALHRACHRRDLKLARMLVQTWGADVQRADEDGLTPLEMACHVNHQGLIRLLVKHGQNVDLNRSDAYGHTLLHRLCLHDGPVATVQTVLDLGVDVNCRDHGHRTPLHLACQLGHTDITQCLLRQASTHVNAADDNGRTALHLVLGRSIASLREQHKMETLRILLEHPRTNVNHRDNTGYTPLAIACRWGHVHLAEELLQHESLRINEQDDNDFAPLHIASRHGNLPLVRVLLQHAHVDVKVQNVAGQTPCHLAAENAHWKVLTALLSKDTTAIHQTDKNGWTVLMHACQQQQQQQDETVVVPVIESLVQTFGANVTCRAVDGITTPLSIAAQGGQLDVIYYLIRQHLLHLDLLN